MIEPIKRGELVLDLACHLGFQLRRCSTFEAGRNRNGRQTRRVRRLFQVEGCGNTLLSRGGSKDAMELFRNFAGHDPQIGPLLEKRGLSSAEAGK